MMTKQDTAQILAVLSAGFPQVAVSKETARVYHEVLLDLDPGTVQQAVARILKTAEWFPPAALIRRTAMELNGSLAESSHSAWAQVLDAVRDHGYTRFPSFGSPLLSEAVRRIGWRTICHSEKPEIVKAQFGKVYDELRQEHDNAVLTGDPLKELSSETVRSVEARKAAAAQDSVVGKDPMEAQEEE
jgi:hypothetical protein